MSEVSLLENLKQRVAAIVWYADVCFHCYKINQSEISQGCFEGKQAWVTCIYFESAVIMIVIDVQYDIA